MSRYYSYETIRYNAKDVTLENGVKHRCIDPDALLDIKPADVVEVVRCKDCKHRYYDKERKLYYCEMYFGLGIVKNNNYCSYGERADK